MVSFAFLDKICDTCHVNATCINNRCVCNAGFIGNGFQCDGKQSIIHSVKSTFFQGNTVDSKNGPCFEGKLDILDKRNFLEFRNFVSVPVRWRCRLLTNFNVLRSKINWSYLSNRLNCAPIFLLLIDLLTSLLSNSWLINFLYIMSPVFTHFRNRRPV